MATKFHLCTPNKYNSNDTVQRREKSDNHDDDDESARKLVPEVCIDVHRVSHDKKWSVSRGSMRWCEFSHDRT